MAFENELGDAITKEIETQNAHLKLTTTHEQTKADLEVAQQNVESAKAYNVKATEKLEAHLKVHAELKTTLTQTEEQKELLNRKLQLTETRLKQVQARQNRIEVQNESIKKQRVVQAQILNNS